MLTIENYVQVNTLFLTWQTSHDRRQRYIVGEVRKTEQGYCLVYSTDTDDFNEARSKGFEGYPAFPLTEKTYNNDVMATFMKRLPPRTRTDFKDYLQSHHLPPSFDGDDFLLITHTGIRLPSDGFNLVPKLSEASIPFDFVMPLAAGSHYLKDYEKPDSIEVGQVLRLVAESDNEHDTNAVKVMLEDTQIGYVIRPLSQTVNDLLRRNVTCQVARKTRIESKLMIYLMISVT